MTKLENVRVVYLYQEKKKRAGGKTEDMMSFIKVDLDLSKRRTKFNIVMISWDRLSR